MWFHHDLRADEGCCTTPSRPIALVDGGLARGFLFSQDGELKVSLVQEGLTRIVKPAGSQRISRGTRRLARA